MVLIPCPARLRFDELGDFGIMRHKFNHSHECPPVSKMDSFAEKKFQTKIAANPEAKPMQLVVGIVFHH
jgi:hypothetical protein